MAGIYVHYPFCKSRCYYCDFYTLTDTHLSGSFIDALLAEIELRKNFLGEKSIDTIYFGGGTPSLLSPGQIQMILDKLYKTFPVGEKPEITIELNPDDVSSLYTKKLKNTDINRISLGIQAFYNYHLQLMNRRHKVFGALKTVDKLQEQGFDNISIDLIYGLPEMSMAEWEKSLKKAVSMDIQHISAYHLTYEENTVFYKLKKSGMLKPPSDEFSQSQFEMMVDFFEKNDFIHYEISNFGRMGRFSKHNISYWKNEPYLGLGPSAHSFDGTKRYWNLPDISRYIRLEHKHNDIRKEETLSAKDRYNEFLMTSLRTYWGVDSRTIGKEFGETVASEFEKQIQTFVTSGHVHQKGSNYYLTRTGMFISDTVISKLFLPN